MRASASAGWAFALAGCSWTPRNAAAPSADNSQEGEAGQPDGAAAQATQLDDGLVPIEGGTFTMGSPADEPWRSDDEVEHEVTVSDFYLSPTEVAQRDYDALMGKDGTAAEDIPAANVTWYDAIAYSTDYNTCLDEAQRDQNRQARPALATHIGDMDRCGTIYLGYPNWWASIPMPIATYLESYDFSGKTIRPFCSNGGGGLGQSVTAISKLAPRAHVSQGLSIYYSGGSDLPQVVADWIAQDD